MHRIGTINRRGEVLCSRQAGAASCMASRALRCSVTLLLEMSWKAAGLAFFLVCFQQARRTLVHATCALSLIIQVVGLRDERLTRKCF